MSAATRLEVTVRLRVPVGGVVERRARLVEGPAGWGECSPLPSWTEAEMANAEQAAEEAAARGFPPALRRRVTVNAMVPRVEPAVAARLAVASGCATIKVKVGDAGGWARVAAVRAAVGRNVRIRLDANSAWDVDTALAELRALAVHGIELVEDPVATLAELAALRRRSPVAVAAEMSVRTVAAARRLRELDAADALVLKVQPCGGVRAALELAELAGVPAIPTSMHETSVGVAAGVALAAALPDLAFACGLATVSVLPIDVTTVPLVPIGGVLRRRAVAPDPVLLARYSVRPSVVAQEARS
ncbi:MAG TPA: enolase C-terminal domain-like protein [Candidatus Dormibacteraeota bacterium]|nr:enolase C-terminal domain-like protein [Candidatus Dormibacteraeota bacterium]